MKSRLRSTEVIGEEVQTINEWLDAASTFDSLCALPAMLRMIALSESAGGTVAIGMYCGCCVGIKYRYRCPFGEGDPKQGKRERRQDSIARAR